MFRNYYFFLLIALLCQSPLSGQSSIQPTEGLVALSTVPVKNMPALDNAFLQAIENERLGPGIAPRYAENIEVSINPQTDGIWEETKSSDLVWRLRIKSRGAYSINLGFSQYEMPAGGSLLLYDPQYKNIKGPFTPSDNEEHEQLWTPILDGDELIMEVVIPAGQQSALKLHLSYVNHAFLDFNALASGSCNLDVICDSEDGWGIIDQYRDIIQSVAVISTGGGTFCTGFLVNNVEQDCTPFFMTANHCGINSGNAASLVTYWNFINSFCRQPGSPASGGGGNGILNDFNSGATFRAGSGNSDFTLVELDDPISPTANAFFAGWDARAAAISSAIAVHHPRTDEKRISFENDPLMFTNGFGNSPSNNFTHVRVVDWDVGTTEPGSSGSPLFDQDKRVVGQLHGGGAACGNNSSDWYGAFATSWDAGGNSSSRLRDWLDPANTGTLTIDGRYANGCDFSITVNPSLVTLCPFENATIDLTVSEAFTGTVSLSTSGLPFGVNANFDDSTISPGNSTSLTLSASGSVNAGVYSFTIEGAQGSNDAQVTVQLTILAGGSNTPDLSEPDDGATGIAANPHLVWEEISGANAYEIEIATDPFFSNIVETGTSISADFIPRFANNALTTYYWRVRVLSDCDTGDFSDEYSFTTSNIACQTLHFDAPLNINNNGTPTVSSSANFDDNYEITSVTAQMEVTHTWIGDISVTLSSPEATQITLMDRPGSPASTNGCSLDNINITLSDEAFNSANDLEDTCNPPGAGTGPFYALEGIYRPVDAFDLFAGQNPSGNWTMTLSDNVDADGGAVDEWNITVCYFLPIPPPTITNNNTLPVPHNESEIITSDYLLVSDENSAPDELIFTLTNLPFNGDLYLNGAFLSFGDTFTQQDINDGNLSYQHDGSTFLSDNFPFDVTNAGGETLSNQTFNIEIIVETLAANLEISQTLACADNTNGVVTATASGGVPPYQYHLNDDNLETSNVFSGLSAGNYTVTVIDELGNSVNTNTVTITAPPLLTANANVNETMITVNTSGGTPAYQYSLNGVDFQNENTFTNLANGDYIIWVQDQNACQITVAATVAVNTLVVSGQVINHVSCNGAMDGSISANVSGGTMPYQYQVNGGDFQNENTFTGLGIGEYVITVLDSEGFTIQTSSLNITQPTTLSANTNVDETTVTVNASGGTPTYQYSLNGVDFQNENTFTNLANGDYIIWVQDQNACQITVSATVAVNTLVVSGQVINHVSCNGAMDGSISANVSGGTMSYQYQVNGGDFQDENTFTGLANGEYVITVLDSEGFTMQTSSLNITQPTTLSANTNVDETTITVNASGGTPTYQYSLNGVDFQNENTFTNLANGDYIIWVQDQNACQITVSATVAVNTLVVSGQVINHVSCNGAMDGSISVNVSGGTMPYQYQVNGGGLQNENTFTGLGIGEYVITVLDSEGFTIQTSTLTITEPTSLTVSAAAEESTVTIDVAGGTPPYTYSINGEDFFSENVFQDMPNGDYTVTVRDAFGCLQTAMVTVLANTLFSEVFIVNNISCFGAQDGSIIGQALGGTAPYQYSIDGENFQDAPTFNDLAPGEYVLTILDDNGFTNQSMSVILSNPPLLSLSLAINADTITATSSGGTGAHLYSLDGQNYSDSAVFMDLPNGEYLVYVIDENACTATMEAVIDVNNFTATASLVQNPSCFEGGDGSIMATVTNGQAPFSYSLDGENFQNEPLFINLPAGIYTITAQDANGLSIETDPIELFAPTALEIMLSINANTIIVEATGGTPPYAYSLDGKNFQDSPEFTILSGGEFQIWVMDNNGCLVMAPETIVINNINDLDKHVNWLLYPNPTKGACIIALPLTIKGVAKLTIFNVLGQNVYQQTIPSTRSEETPLNLDYLPTGTYEVVLEVNELRGVKKLIIQ